MADRIRVNTYDLQRYITRLNNVRSRASNLHGRVQRLYWTGEVRGIYELYRRNRFSGGASTLYRIRNAIAELLSDIEAVENYFSSVDPLNFQEPRNSLVQMTNRRDAGANKFTDLIREFIRNMGKVVDIATFRQLSCALTGARDCTSTKDDPDAEEKDLVEKVLKFAGKIATGAEKFGDSDEAGLVGPFIGFFSTAYGMYRDRDKQNYGTLASGIGNLIKDAGKITDTIYDYAEDKASLFKAKSMYDQYGYKIKGAKLFTEALALAGDGVKLFHDSGNEDRTVYENWADLVGLYGDGVGLLGDVYIYEKFGEKVIKGVSSSKGAVNQILATKFDVAPIDRAGLDKANLAMSFIRMGFSGIEGGITEYGKMSADGTVTVGDWSSVVGASAAGALAEDISILTFGIVDVDGEKFYTSWKDSVFEFKDKVPWLKNTIDNQDNNIVARFGASMVASVGGSLYGLGNAIIDKTTEMYQDKMEYTRDIQEKAANLIMANDALAAYMSSEDNTFTNNVVTRAFVGAQAYATAEAQSFFVDASNFFTNLFN